MRVDSNQISVVIQGPIFGFPTAPAEEQWTRRAIESIREWLPKAEVILSTWEGADLTGLTPDITILNKDPGAYVRDLQTGQKANLNRQIVTTRAGIAAATRTYVLKIRSDSILESIHFLDFWGRFEKRGSHLSFTRERVIASTCYSVNPLKGPRLMCYHVSDWYFFGLREDVFDIWDIPLAPEPETTQYFQNRPFPDRDPEKTNTARYRAEQWIWLMFLKKHTAIEFDHYVDYSTQHVINTVLSIANNLILMEPELFRLLPRSTNVILPTDRSCWVFTHADWMLTYIRGIDT